MRHANTPASSGTPWERARTRHVLGALQSFHKQSDRACDQGCGRCSKRLGRSHSNCCAGSVHSTGAGAKRRNSAVATCERFNAIFDALSVEAVDALAQDWSILVSFALPDFHSLDEVLDIIEGGNAL